MKLYAVNTKWDIGTIKEVEVIKETPKTYTIKLDGWGVGNLVRKSEMRVYGNLLVKTYDEAIEKTKELLKARIKTSEERIKTLIADIEKYNTMLADIEKGGTE